MDGSQKEILEIFSKIDRRKYYPSILDAPKGCFDRSSLTRLIERSNSPIYFANTWLLHYKGIHLLSLCKLLSSSRCFCIITSKYYSGTIKFMHDGKLL